MDTKCKHPSGVEKSKYYPATRFQPAEAVVVVVCDECGKTLDWTDARDLGMIVKDEYGRIVVAIAAITKCEGACENHTGEVVTVRVKSVKGYDWGEFDYCEEAIAEDRRRGLMVSKV